MMNDKGYVIKIGDRVLPTAYMVRDSWKCTPSTRTVKKYTDGNGREHVHEMIHKRTKIEFQLEEHALRDHDDIVSYFQKLSNVNIEYLNDHTCTYDNGIFHIEDIQWKHKKTFDHDIWYEPTNITMTEY